MGFNWVRLVSRLSPMPGGIPALLLGSAAFVLLVTSTPLWPQVRVNLHAGDPEWASVILEDAPSGFYDMRNHMDGMLREVRCSRSGSVESADGAVSVDECGALTWQFRLREYSTQGTLASNQLNWFDKNHDWWLITGDSAILRTQTSDLGVGIEFQLDGQALQVQAGSQRLSQSHEAPNFWLLGSADFVDKGQVRHFFDRRPVPNRLVGMLNVHAEAIRFLSEKLVMNRLPSVFWMGIDNWKLGTGGAAGKGLILVNYPIGEEDFDVPGRAITLYTLLHEHAHSAFDAKTLWIAESVASYLAVRAVEEVAPDLHPFLEAAFIEPASTHETPLPMLGELAAAGDGKAYSQLYEGAALWMALEEVMEHHNPSEDFLSHLPRLLEEGFGSDGGTDKKALAELIGISYSQLSPVLEQYLGSG